MAKTIINSNRALTPSPLHKFTLDEWHLNNQFRYRSAKAQQERADRISIEARRLCESAAEIAKSNKEETDHQLREKLNDIEFRKEELLRIRKEIALEIDGSSVYKQRITSTLTSVRRNALAICEKCLVAREGRLGIDLVHDDVERELLKEREMILKAEDSLARVSEDIREQIRKLKATLYYIDNDHFNKERNLHIDRRNVALREIHFDLNTYRGNLQLDRSIMVNEWEQQTNDNVVNANKEVNGAKHLRSYVDTLIKHTIDGLLEQKNVTNKALKRRIEQTQEAKARLELQHSEVVKQVAAMSNNIAQIKSSIADKEGFMALVNARLESRCQRPETEVTRDLVEANLAKEAYVLREIVGNLQQMLREAETSLRYLFKTQVQLEEDINVKANTLQIDDVECAILRQSMDYHAH